MNYPRGPRAHSVVSTPISTSPITWHDEPRRAAFERWLADVATRRGLAPQSLRSASSDASFRRYFRVDGSDGAGGASFIVMDAPPPQEDVRPFITVAKLLHDAGLQAPQVLEQDVAQGFLLLTDLGSRLYLNELNEARARGDAKRVDALMRSALSALVQWQSRADASGLPPYDDALLRRELALFPDWCVTREFGIAWSDAQQQRGSAHAGSLGKDGFEAVRARAPNAVRSGSAPVAVCSPGSADRPRATRSRPRPRRCSPRLPWLAVAHRKGVDH